MPGNKPRPKAVSKKQRKLMGMAHAIKEGKMSASVSPQAAKVAHTMNKGDLRSMAETKEAGLPQKKSKSRKPSSMATTMNRIKKKRRR